MNTIKQKSRRKKVRRIKKRVKTMNKFTKLEDETLAESVSRFSPLYDPRDIDHKDLKTIEAIWAEVSTLVGRSGDECKKRFKNLQNAYRRNKIGRKQGTGSSAITNPTEWSLAPYLSFLEDIPLESNSTSNFNNEFLQNECMKENNCEEDDITLKVSIDEQVLHKNSSKKDNKRKYMIGILETKSNDLNKDLKTSETLVVNSSLKEPDDDIDLFFKSLASSVKKLPPNLVIQAKLKCLILVSELEHQFLEISDKPSG